MEKIMNNHQVSIEELKRVVNTLEEHMIKDNMQRLLTIETIEKLNEQCKALTLSPKYTELTEEELSNGYSNDIIPAESRTSAGFPNHPKPQLLWSFSTSA